MTAPQRIAVYAKFPDDLLKTEDSEGAEKVVAELTQQLQRQKIRACSKIINVKIKMGWVNEDFINNFWSVYVYGDLHRVPRIALKPSLKKRNKNRYVRRIKR